MNEFVDSLGFTNVKIDEYNTDEFEIIIDFSISEKYNFYISVKRPHMRGNTINHLFLNGKECPCCKGKIKSRSQTICPKLQTHIDDITKCLLNHPNVRLRRLFI